MIDPRACTVEELCGLTLVGGDGIELGLVQTVFLDVTGTPVWGGVRLAPQPHETLVPLARAVVLGRELRIPYVAGQIYGCPHHDVHWPLDPDREAAFIRFYLPQQRGPETGTGAAVDPGEDEWVHPGSTP